MKKIVYSLLLLGASLNVRAQGNPCTGPQPNLIAHWEFTNGSLVDAVSGLSGGAFYAPGVPATLTSCPGQNGVPNTAVKFGGQYVKVPYDPIMNLKSWTISATVAADDWNPNICQGNSIVWRGSQFSGNHYDLEFFDNAYDSSCTVYSYKEVFAGGASGSGGFPETDWLNNPPTPAPPLSFPNPFINIGQWYCVTLRYDDNTKMLDLFVDGVHTFSKKWMGTNTGPTMDDLFIGSSDNPSSANAYLFFGRMDDLRIYDGAINCFPALSNLCVSCHNSYPAPTPVLHWGFDGNNGKNPLEDDISHLIATPFGGVSQTAGQSGAPFTAMKFNGTSDYLMVPYNPVMDLQSWTIRALIRPDGFYNGPCQGNIIVWRGPQFSANHYNLMFTDNAFDSGDCNTITGYHPGNTVFTAGAAGNNQTPSYTSPITDWLNGPASNPMNAYIIPGEWYCVTASYDGTTPGGRMRLFVNGLLVYDNPWQNQYGIPTAEDLFIGGNSSAFPYYFNGIIDDIAIYSGATSCPMSCFNAFNGQPKMPTGVTKVNNGTGLAITPNPATNEVKVTIPASWGKTTWTLTNSTGQVLQTGEIKANTTQAVINVSNLPVGMYILKAEHGTSSEYQKLIKN